MEMKHEIKTAISKAMRKLVGLSLNEKAMNGHNIEVALHGRFNHDIWVCQHGGKDLLIINAPTSINDINNFESKIEKLMAEIKAKFHDPKYILATLNTPVNE